MRARICERAANQRRVNHRGLSLYVSVSYVASDSHSRARRASDGPAGSCQTLGNINAWDACLEDGNRPLVRKV